MVSARKHAHYFRNVAHLNEVDVYRVLELFNVTDQALGHAIKKLLAPGGRGAGKDFRRDVQEAVDTLTRRLEMLDEDAVQDFEADVVVPPAPEYDPASVALRGGERLSFDADWSGWKGGPCPYPKEAVVQIRRKDGGEVIMAAKFFDWGHSGGQLDIIACRVVGHA